MTFDTPQRRLQGRTVGPARPSAGFTLIELLIAVAVIGILAAIAIPNYVGYLEGARRTDAHAGLMQAAQQLERCYTANYIYSGCSITTTSPEEIYTISVSIIGVDGAGFTLTANTDESDGCAADITLNHQGVRTPEGCW